MVRPSAGAHAWFELLYVHAQVLSLLERELQEQTGLPLPWYEVLVQLGRRPDGRMRMLDLSRAVLLSKSGLTRLVARMEDAGLVERHTPRDDLRATYAVLTAEGRKAHDRAVPLHVRGVEEHFGRHLSAAEAATLRDVLDRVARAEGAGSPHPAD